MEIQARGTAEENFRGATRSDSPAGSAAATCTMIDNRMRQLRKVQPTLLFQFLVYGGVACLFVALLMASGKGGLAGVFGVPVVLIGLAIVWILVETGVLPRLIATLLAGRFAEWHGLAHRLFVKDDDQAIRTNEPGNPLIR